MTGKINKALKVSLIVAMTFLFLFGFFVFEKKDVKAQSAAGDAIAVRVIANPEHLSPLSWYKSKGFSGSPKPLIVDGYQAVKDGRTVYVNVANISSLEGSCHYTHTPCISDAQCYNDTCDLPPFYTNIYLISYNQNANADTAAIFNQILGNWKFNTNLTDGGKCFTACNANSDCSLNSVCNSGRCQQSCQKDSDCSANASCLNSACRQNCLEDSDCSGGALCDSVKAKITRDTLRLGEVNDLKSVINYYNANIHHYPLLNSGTYLPGQTISTWPSWKGEFASELGITPPVDPINKLGDCGGSQYDPLTCWSAAGKSFSSGNDVNLTGKNILPFNSSVFVYSTPDQGKSYHVCAMMESAYAAGNVDACAGSASYNPAPTVNCGSLVGVQGQSFLGYISVAGSNNKPMLISFPDLPAAFNVTTDSNSATYSEDSNCQNDFSTIINAVTAKRKSANKLLKDITGSTWSANHCFSDPGNQFYKYYDAGLCAQAENDNKNAIGLTDYSGPAFVFDENEGEVADVPCVQDTVTVDGCGIANIPFFQCKGGASANTVFSKATINSRNITAGTYPITIKVTNGNSIKTQTCTINISSAANIIYPVADQTVHQGKNINFFLYANSTQKKYDGLSFSLASGPASMPVSCGGSAVTVAADGRASCKVSFTANENFNGQITVSASDGAGDSFASQQFNLNVFDNPPVMNPINCQKSVRAGVAYPDCKVTAKDPDGDSISSYRLLPGTSLPAGFSFASDGTFSESGAQEGVYIFNFEAIDQYNAVSQPLKFTINVNSFCGDGKKESPNTELKGGHAGDGYEDCDCGGSQNYLSCVAANFVNGAYLVQQNSITGVPSVAQSTALWQYGCTSDCASANGGFCGDATTQDGLLGKYGAKESIGNEYSAHSATNYGEQCDDGNNINGDGCNTFDASGKPSCKWVCGDGTVSDGRYADFLNGIELNSLGKIYHSREIAYNIDNQPEQCDFGNNLNCCQNCRWTTNPSPSSILTGVADPANGLKITLPLNRGVSSLTFNAQPSIIPNDLSDYPVAIVAISDISNPPSDSTIPNMIAGLDSMVNSFSAWSTKKNEDVMFGAFGFGDNCFQNICYPVALVDLKNNSFNQGLLTDSIGEYPPEGVGDGSPGSRSYLDSAVPEAELMLKQQPANFNKYLIILTDGCTCSFDSNVTTAINKVKKDGIKIYTVAYSDSWKNQLCAWSNDNGDITDWKKTAACYNNNFSYESATDGSDMTTILAKIQADILSGVPQKFTVSAVLPSVNKSVASSPLQTSQGGTVSGIQLNTNSLLNCDISGSGCFSNVYLTSSFNGSGDVNITNVQASFLPACQR
jgi:cysteine-rich repeat protein